MWRIPWIIHVQKKKPLITGDIFSGDIFLTMWRILSFNM